MNRTVKFFILELLHRLGLEIRRVPPNSDPMVPPYYIRTLVGAFASIDFYLTLGEEYIQRFRELCDLRPEHDVLDVGCGCGREAVPLTRYLSPQARYEGLDIDKVVLNWAARNITPRFANFRFQHANVYNSVYNPGGKSSVHDYRFPYADSSFDFTFLISVFTHMEPPGLENYLREIVRVLRSGGRCFITFFLLNPESIAALQAGTASQKFPHDCGNYWVESKECPEIAVAFSEDYIRQLFNRVGLEIVEPIGYGYWTGSRNDWNYQDNIIAIKR